MIHPDDLLTADWGPGVDDRDIAASVRIIKAGLRPRFVYFVEARSWEEETMPALVKIGTTANPDRRLKDIEATRSRGPEWLSDKDDLATLRYMGLLPGDEQLERQLHRTFSAHRVSGEWFWLDPIEEPIDILLANYCVCDLCRVMDDLPSYFDLERGLSED